MPAGKMRLCSSCGQRRVAYTAAPYSAVIARGGVACRVQIPALVAYWCGGCGAVSTSESAEREISAALASAPPPPGLQTAPSFGIVVARLETSSSRATTIKTGRVHVSTSEFPRLCHYTREPAVAFIRKKQTRKGVVYQVVESRREGKRVRQVVLASLSHSPTIGEAIARVEAFMASPMIDPDRLRQHWNPVLVKLRRVKEKTGLP